MNAFQKNFLRESPSGGQRAWLAAFGKHPGWDDHIDDLGIETESLAQAKRHIYFEGVTSQIDSGAWDKLGPGERMDGFDHLFLWRRGAGSLLGCIKSSVDGKGRTRFPIIVCAQFAGLPLDRVLQELRAQVVAAMAACAARKVADDVRNDIGQAREALRRTVAGAPVAGAGVEPVSAAISRLVNQPPAGGREGLHRILYQVKNHLAPWAPGGHAEKEGGTTAAVHLRLPRVAGDDAEALGAWAGLLGSQLDPDAPCLLILPHAGEWVDAIVGEPAKGDFFSLRANTRALPCASDVPYEMDAAFRAEADALLADLARGVLGPRTIFGTGDSAPPVRKLAGAAQQQAQNLTTRLHGASQRIALRAGAVALVAAIAAVVLWRIQSRSAAPASPGPATKNVTTAPVTPAPVTPPKTGPTTPADDWRILGHAFFDWVGPLQRTLEEDSARRNRWSADPYLQSHVLTVLGQAGAASQFDPATILGETVPVTDSGPLPVGLSVPERAEKISAGARKVEQLAAALAAWPVFVQVRADAARIDGWGWSGALADSAVPQKLPLDSTLPGAVDRVLALAPKLASAATAGAAAQAAAQKLRAADDPALAAAATELLHEAAGAHSPDELGAAAARIQSSITPVATLLDGDWAKGPIDRKRFLAERGEAWAGGAKGGELLKKWVAEVPGWAPVPAASLPSQAGGWDQAQKSATEARARLAAVDQAGAAALAARQKAIEKEWAAFTATPVLKKDLATYASRAAPLVDKMKAFATEVTADADKRADPSIWAQRLGEIRIAESAVVDAEWRKQRDSWLANGAVEALRTDLPRFAELRDRSARVEAWLRDLATTKELPESYPPDKVTDPGLARDLRTQTQNLREGALAKLIVMTVWPKGLPGETSAEFMAKPTARAVIADYGKAYGELIDFGTDASHLLPLLDEGTAWQDKSAIINSTSSRSFTGRRAEFSQLPRMTELLGRFDALGQLNESSDRAHLIEIVHSGPLAESVTSWYRLGNLPDWLQKDDDLAADLQMNALLTERARRDLAKNASGLTAFGDRMGTYRRARWQAAFLRAKDDGDYQRLLGAIDDFGVVESDLGAPAKFDLLLARLRKLPWTTMNKSEALAQRTKAIALLQAITGTEAARAQALAAELQKIDFEVGQVDLRVEGPGKPVNGQGAVWTFDPPGPGGTISYSWTSPAKHTHRLEFAQLLLPSGQSVWLGTTEVPVQLFIDWVDYQQAWPRVIDEHKDLLEDFGAVAARRGPRTWFVKKDGPDRKQWHFVRETGWRVPTAPGDTVPAPGELSPLNYVSFSAAKDISATLQCRLPAEAEWRAALKAETAAGAATALPNLRDARWHKEHDFRLAQKDDQPDFDCFTPLSNLPATLGSSGEAKAATDKDDGYLWFADVHSGAAHVFSHLVGNVAEFVTNDKGTVGVIGGSAISPPELPVDTWYEAGDPTQGFADVGFRLAFSVGQLSGAARVSLVLAAAHFAPAQK